MLRKISPLAALALVLAVPALASPPHPAGHGTTVVRALVCDKLVKLQSVSPTAKLVGLSGRIGSRPLRYWNESPSTSYLYGTATFVEVHMVRRTLYVRAVRTVPVCGRLHLSYSW